MRPLELVLFATEPRLVGNARRAGIRSMIVDLEWRGKEQRQLGADTEINRHRPEELEILRSDGVPKRICRLNRLGTWTRDEVDAAISAGANRLLLPMVESVDEVESLFEWIGGRCELGILVETERAVRIAHRLAELPLAQVYVGLNDLAISRGLRSDGGEIEGGEIFDAVADGTVQSLRRTFARHDFGFGGVTVAGGGSPVPCRLLMAEMSRLGCTFSFLRRSFKRDVKGRDMGAEVARIHELWRRLGRRSPSEVDHDHEELLDRLKELRSRRLDRAVS